MILGMDVSPAVYHRGGIGVYTHALYTALHNLPASPDCRPFYNQSGEQADLAWLKQSPHKLPWRNKAWRLRVMAAHWTGRSQDHLFPDMDVFLATDHLLPNLHAAKTVFVIQDVSFRLTRTASSWNKLFLASMLPHFLRKATTIITPSKATCMDIHRLYDVPLQRVHVIPDGVDPVFRPAATQTQASIREKYSLPERYILAVGTIEPRKNYTKLLQAYAALGSAVKYIPLVIAGRPGWRSKRFYRTLERLDFAGNVRLLNYVPYADLPGLYTAATIFVYPSLYEGFGLPPLEAMACGTPVISSNTSSLPEVIGEAGIMIPPTDTQAWDHSIGMLLKDHKLREALRQKGLAHVRQFTWQRTAQATYAVCQSCLNTT